MALGHISRIVTNRGFGFILEDAHSDEIEFHWTALSGGDFDQLRVGQRVQFETQQDHRSEFRVRAVKVRLVGET